MADENLHIQANNQYFEADPAFARHTHELAGLVLSGFGASEDDMAAPEPVVSPADAKAIAEAAKMLPDDDVDETVQSNEQGRRIVLGSRTHRGDLKDGRGFSLGALRRMSHGTDSIAEVNSLSDDSEPYRMSFPLPQIPTSGFNGGVLHDAHRRNQARRI